MQTLTPFLYFRTVQDRQYTLKSNVYHTAQLFGVACEVGDALRHLVISYHTAQLFGVACEVGDALRHLVISYHTTQLFGVACEVGDALRHLVISYHTAAWHRV